MLNRRLPTLVFSVVVGFTFVAALPGGSMITAILGISFLIFIHEWGHFMACRLTGTRTETFSIGFGTRLFGWEKDRNGKRRFTVGRRQLDPADNAMDFRIALVPLGGYVKMAGEIPGERPGPPRPDEFPSKSAWARIFIVSAGVIMNFITAVVFYFIAIQFEKTYRAPIVGHVSGGGAAWQAGIEPGDRITAINGNDTPTWIDLQMEIAFSSPTDVAPIDVVRAGEQLPQIQVKPNYDEERGILQYGVSPVFGLELGTGEGAFTIGADEPVTVAGAPARGGAQVNRLLQLALSIGNKAIVLENRAGQTHTLAVTPPAKDTEDPLQLGAKVGLAPYAPPVVKALRGKAADVLAVGDHVLSVTSGAATLRIANDNEAQALVFRPEIASIRVLREEKEFDLDVGLKTQAEVAAFLADVSLESEPGNRVHPLASGHQHPAGNAVYRYPSAPAADAGVPAGARVVKIGTVITRSWQDIYNALQKAKVGEPLAFHLKLEDGTEKEVQIRPIELAFVGELSATIVPYRENFQPDGMLQAFGMGASRAVRETKNVFRTIGALFMGNISFNKNIAGPITLVTASKRFAEDSFLQLLWFLAYVSVMLAVLNILPIPVLDGGHLLFILIEKIKGSPLKEETIYNFQKVGFLLLLVLMFFAFKNDITRLFNS